jgi:hypothetical protein
MITKDTVRDSFLEELGLKTVLKLPICVETPILPVGRPRGDVGGECFAPHDPPTKMM